MTILPNKKPPANKTSPDNNDIASDSSHYINEYPGLGGAQSLPGGKNASGWGQNVRTDLPPGQKPWTPISTTSTRWNSSECAGEKRTSSSCPEVEFSFDDNSVVYDSVVVPSANKRRHRHSTNVSSAAVVSVTNGNGVNSGVARLRGSLRCPAGNVPPPQSVVIGNSPGRSPSPELGCNSPTEGGYNSEDEYSHLGLELSEAEWQEKDLRFERLMNKKGFIMKKMDEDGSCLFRAVADQVFGDQEMHGSVREHCMNYILQNSDYFSHYVTEDLSEYVRRKRFLDVHGNHLEIQSLSEMYNRPIHIYCYSIEPINIFHGINQSELTSSMYDPIRLCYHRGIHYNSLVDPHKPTIGVGLGLPGYNPGLADRNLVGQAVKDSEELVEKTMLDDKIRATDWEATNEVIEEQVARESYLQWLRDNERRNSIPSGGNCASATVTSGDLRSSKRSHPKVKIASNDTLTTGVSHASVVVSSPEPCFSGSNLIPHCGGSPRAGCSSSELDRNSPKPGSSSQITERLPNIDEDGNFCQQAETAGFINGLPPNIFGLEDWSDTDMLTQVLAVSQQEYLDSLKERKLRSDKEQGLIPELEDEQHTSVASSTINASSSSPV